MKSETKLLADFLADVVMTGYYLAEPPKNHSQQLHDAEAKCLKVIFAYQPLRIQKIAELAHTTKSRATQLVHSLENRKLVQRQSGADHRVVMISTTRKGAQVVEDLRKKYFQLAESIDKKIGHERTLQLCEILADISPLTTVEIKREKE